jgi:hypothetical protein
MEGVPNCFIRVSYEDALLGFGFELIRLNPFDISVATPNIKKRQLRFLTKPDDVIPTDLDGALFNVNAAVSNA